jgi:hypothetical protein
MGLSMGLIQQVRYFPFVVPDGVFQASLPVGAGGSPLLALNQIASQQVWARLRALRALPQAGVGLTVAADGYQTPLVDTGGLGLLPPPAGWDARVWDVRALDSLTVRVANNTGAAVSNWWAAWSVEFAAVPLPVRARHATLYPPLTAADQGLLAEQAADPVAASTEPRTVPWILRNEFGPAIRQAVVLSQTLTVAPGTPALFVQEARTDAHECLVLTGLSVSPGSGTDGLTVVIGRDDEDAFYTTPAYPLGQAGALPWCLIAPRTLRISCTATTTVTGVALAATIWHVRLTPAIQARLGISVPAAVTQAEAVGAL